MPNPFRLALIGFIIVFTGAVLYSMWTETLMPFLRVGDYFRFTLNLIGLPLILLGVGLFAWGGVVFTRNTYQLMDSETFNNNREILQAQPPAEVRRMVEAQQWRLMFGAWKLGLWWLAGGFALIALGSVIINVIGA